MGIADCSRHDLKGVPTVYNDHSKHRIAVERKKVQGQDTVCVHNYAPQMPLSRANALLFGIYLIQEALGVSEMPEECDLISLRQHYKELKDASEQEPGSKSKKGSAT